MRIPRAVARFNRRITNPIQRMWADKLPGFALVVHTGRKSGRTYRTPVNAFSVPGGFAVLLGYGTRTDWVRNLLAAGGGELVHRRQRYLVTAPRLVNGAEARALLPRALRVVSRIVRNDDVLCVEAVPA